MAHYVIHPNRVEMTLDFHRLDEDVLRVLQSLKAEVKKLAAKKGFSEGNLWQWSYEEHSLKTQENGREFPSGLLK